MPYYDRDTLEEILRDGFSRGAPTYNELELLALYYREQGYGKIGIRKRVIEMSRTLYTRFNRILYFEMIEKAVRTAMKKGKIADITEVVVYEEELNEIRKIRNYKAQLIIFTFLIMAKSYPQWGYNSTSSRDADVKNMLGISGTRVSYRMFLRDYRKKLENEGLLKYIIYRRQRLKSKYLLPFALKEGTPMMVFSDKNNILDSAIRYKEWTGGELFWCVDCGEEGIKTSPRQLRCPSCADKRVKKKDRERKKK